MLCVGRIIIFISVLLYSIGTFTGNKTQTNLDQLTLNLNLLTCIPIKEWETVERISIDDLCTKINSNPGVQIDTIVHTTSPTSSFVRMVSGIQQVTDEPIFVFVSGWAGSPGNPPYRYNGNAAYYAHLYHKAGIITGPYICYDNQNYTYKTASFGQRPDQDVLANVLDGVQRTNPHAKIVLVGFSCGATTILNFIAQHPLKNNFNVQAAILESPFICLQNVLKHTLRSYIACLGVPIAHLITRFLPSYDQTAPTILTTAHEIDKKIPLFIGAIEHDHVISYQGIKEIVQKLSENMLNEVRFFSERSTLYRHSYLACNPLYARAARSFLSEYGLA